MNCYSMLSLHVKVCKCVKEEKLNVRKLTKYNYYNPRIIISLHSNQDKKSGMKICKQNEQINAMTKSIQYFIRMKFPRKFCLSPYHKKITPVIFQRDKT